MKRIFPLLIVFWSVAAYSQQPWEINDPRVRWINVRELPCSDCIAKWEVIGGVPTSELDSLGFDDMASGNGDKGYFEFYGDAWPVSGGFHGELMWPPSLFILDMIYGDRNRWHYVESVDQGYCSGDYVPSDSMYPIDGFGLWRHDPTQPFGLWRINKGYTVLAMHSYAWRIIPCPLNEESNPKLKLFFTDANYDSNMTDNTVFSGDSPLYLKAITVYHPDSIPVTISLRHHPDTTKTIYLRPLQTNDTLYCGNLANSRILGLESYDRVIANAVLHDDSASNRIRVCLPWILTSSDNVYIRTDSMKITADFTARLTIFDDSSSELISPPTLIDTVGYKYKSKWIANANLTGQDTSLHKPYYRQFPFGTIYRKWNKSAGSCAVTFNRDSLYVVGGSLTIESKGALKHINRINNSFLKTTDVINQGDSIPTRKIIVDVDPINDTLKAWLGSDQARAIAWQEGAGFTNNQPPNAAMNKWNNYWEVDAGHPNNTRTPCEGDWSDDAGIMQLNRHTLDSTFDGSRPGPYPDSGRYYCTWDSLAWNWQANIKCGLWWLNIALPSRMDKGSQPSWPDSCSFGNCDTVPDTPNKEDLANYGYHAGETHMRDITNSTLWTKYITNGENDYAKYCKYVRKWKYRPNRQGLW